MPDFSFSVYLLGLFLGQRRWTVRNSSHSIQGSRSPCTLCSLELIRNTQALLVGELTWVTAVTLIRASVILLYIRIFPTTPVRVAGYGVLTVNLAYFIATVLACCLICRPLAYSWDNSIDGKCGDAKSLDMFIGVFNLLMDVVTVVLPMPVLWGLQMPTGRKVILSGLFSMGIT